MSESEMPDGSAGQETGDQPSATTLRERLLQSNAPVEVTLPKAGVVRIRPSLSLGALEAFAAADSPPVAFRAMVAESVEDSRASSLELHEEDAEAIARMYATRGEFLAAFDEARKGMAVAEAFSAGLMSSKAWQLMDESRLAVPDLFGDQFREMQRVVDSYASSFQRFDHAYARIADMVPKFELPDLAVAPPHLNLGLEWNSHLKGIGSAFADVSRLSQTMTEKLGRWTTLTNEFSAHGHLDKVLLEHSSFLNGLAGRTLLGASLLERHSAMFSTFEQLTDALRVPALAWVDKLDLTRHAFDSADDFVRASQGYFQSPRLRSPGEWNPPGPTGEQARTTQRGIIATATETDELVHTTTGRVLRLERSTALFVSEIIETQIETRLAPYAPLLARLTALASPPSFTELLREFAITFARDHWRTLWSKEGVEFKPGPEGIAQSSLSLFLQGHLRGCAFVGRELRNGDGFVDVLVNFLGTEYVVEIKIVGGSWGIGAAKAGLAQLDEYVQNYSAAEAFLLVFDGRRTGRGERLEDEYALASGARATVISVRCFFDAPSRR